MGRFNKIISYIKKNKVKNALIGSSSIGVSLLAFIHSDYLFFHQLIKSDPGIIREMSKRMMHFIFNFRFLYYRTCPFSLYFKPDEGIIISDYTYRFIRNNEYNIYDILRVAKLDYKFANKIAIRMLRNCEDNICVDTSVLQLTELDEEFLGELATELLRNCKGPTYIEKHCYGNNNKMLRWSIVNRDDDLAVSLVDNQEAIKSPGYAYSIKLAERYGMNDLVTRMKNNLEKLKN